MRIIAGAKLLVSLLTRLRGEERALGLKWDHCWEFVLGGCVVPVRHDGEASQLYDSSL
mgnify:CR=1 FL=1